MDGSDGLPDGLPEEVREFLSTCSPEMVSEVLACLRVTTQRHAADKHAVTSTVQPGYFKATVTTTTPSSMKSGKAATGTGITKKKSTKKAKNEPAGPPKRPVNSWMCYRKFYSTFLAPNTQKAISKVLKLWWKADPFTAKWAVLAKAYSLVRGGLCKSEAPLDVFFEHCAELMGIVPPEQYQELMGWHLGPPQPGDPDKTPTVTRVYTVDVNTLDKALTTTNIGVAELVQHCQQVGFAVQNATADPAQAATDSLTMTVAPTQTIESGFDMTTVNNATFTSTEITDEDIENLNIPPPTYTGSSLERAVPTPTGLQGLNDAVLNIQYNLEHYTTNEFDPTLTNVVSFDPNDRGEDGGDFDAYSLTENLPFDELVGLDWDAFVTDEMMNN